MFYTLEEKRHWRIKERCSRGNVWLVLPNTATEVGMCCLFPGHSDGYSIKLGEDLMEYSNLEASEHTHYTYHPWNFCWMLQFPCFHIRRPEKYGHIRFKIKAIIYDSMGFAIGNAYGMVKAVMNLIGLHTFRNVYLQRAFPEIMINARFHNITNRMYVPCATNHATGSSNSHMIP